jgi:hypothetical protein
MAIYMLFVHKKFTIAAALAATVFIGFCSPVGAQDADERLYVVTHVDALGQNGAVEAAKMLHEFAADSRKDQGSVRFEVLRDPVRLNTSRSLRSGGPGRTLNPIWPSATAGLSGRNYSPCWAALSTNACTRCCPERASGFHAG